MNQFLKVLLALFILATASSCDKDFLQRPPLDEVAAFDYFKKPDDLKAYVNQFYSNAMFPRYADHGSDLNSDNQVSQNPDQRLEGSRTIATGGSIAFGNVRNINYFFDNYKRVEEGYRLEDYQQYLGEAYFFKGLIYFGLLKTYGDIQWLNTALGTTSPELYNPRDPRNVVADNIIASLDSAAMFLSAEKGRGSGRVNKWMALLLQSRVALYEGTWQKYHAGTPFGVATPEPAKYLQKAVDAAGQVIESNVYSVYSTGNTISDYKDLFAQTSYVSNPEVMFWREYNNELSRGSTEFANARNFRMETPAGRTITKELADAYLCRDGKPISSNSLFMGYATLLNEKENRDPRFYQTIATPDDVWKIFPDGRVSYWAEAYNNLNANADYNAPSGYIILKGYNPRMETHVQQYEETPSILYRYGEVLLNYAEAKAELGTLTQEDVNNTIKKLRDRVGMPNLILASITTDPEWDFPALSPVINEIRRERRVELSLEGFRWDDIARWAAADELIVGKRPKGMRAAQIANNPFPVDEQGFLDPFRTALPNGYRFVIGRDYLASIPLTEIVLNPNLTQNPGW